MSTLRQRLREETAEVCGGCYLEREDALLPLESQIWNLLKGLAVSKELLDQEIRVFARKRFAAYPQLPLVLNSVGLRRALLVPFDEAVLPTYRVTVVNWPSPDGKQVEAFTRAPYQADSPQTFFHWAHYLNKTIAQDHAATLALLHSLGPACELVCPPGPLAAATGHGLDLGRSSSRLGRPSRPFAVGYAADCFG